MQEKSKISKTASLVLLLVVCIVFSIWFSASPKKWGVPMGFAVGLAYVIGINTRNN